MIVKRFTVSPFQENCYVCHDNGVAALIDPGTVNASERQQVLDYIEQKDLQVEQLLLTHAHIDHIFGCAFFAEHFSDTFKMHAEDLPLLENAEQQGELFQVPVEAPPMPTALLTEEDTLTVGEATWQVLHTPGHSPGSICFYDPTNRFVINGDTLFQDSIGRTDLWKGSRKQLLASIHEKLLVLDKDVVLYPGHGVETTVGREQANNPFL